MANAIQQQTTKIDTSGIRLIGDLALPAGSRQLVVFVHGSGSSRLSPRNTYVAEALQEAGLGTLLFDLLTPEEEHAEHLTRHLRFDIALLSKRVTATLGWLQRKPELAETSIGLFGASTGAAAALVAAAQLPDVVSAVVSRGGRPDLADAALEHVQASTLLIVGGDDREVLRLNRAALARLHSPRALHVVEHAGHLFEEPGALDDVVRVARQWFVDNLVARPRAWQVGPAAAPRSKRRAP
jgi:putative phosphoribosyl transferase